MDLSKLKALAIDYGTQRIGLALSFGTIADPLTIIPSDQHAVAYICKVIADYKINYVIIGVSENLMEKKSREFAALLKRVIKIPIEFYDETLSTKYVRQKLADQKKSQQHVDHLAAAEFLQEWLDTTAPSSVKPVEKV